MPTQFYNTFAFAMWSQIQEVTFGEMQQHDIMMYHSWHGVYIYTVAICIGKRDDFEIWI
jgi:hypothetical protein